MDNLLSAVVARRSCGLSDQLAFPRTQSRLQRANLDEAYKGSQSTCRRPGIVFVQVYQRAVGTKQFVLQLEIVVPPGAKTTTTGWQTLHDILDCCTKA